MKNYILFHILDLNLKSSFQIASLFHMYIDMGERIAGEQDRPSLIIECPPGPLQIAKHILFFTYIKNWFSIVFPCCTYVSTVMSSAFADILVPPVPLHLM